MYLNILAMGQTATISSDAAGATTAAAAGSTGSSSMVSTIITFVLIIAVFYFLMIRPQRKQEKEKKQLLTTMKKGDKVVTIGGIRGTIAIVKESTIVVKVDDNTRMEFSKSAISTILDKKGAPKKGNDVATSKNGKAEKTEKVEKKVEAPKAEAKENGKVVGEIEPEKVEKTTTNKK